MIIYCKKILSLKYNLNIIFQIIFTPNHKLTSIFLKNRYVKITKTYIENIFLNNKYEKVGSFFLYDKLDSIKFGKKNLVGKKRKLITKKKLHQRTNLEEEQKNFINSFPYLYYLGFYYEDVQIYININFIGRYFIKYFKYQRKLFLYDNYFKITSRNHLF